MISTVLWLLYDFLPLKNGVNVPVFRFRIRMFWASRIRIRIRESEVRIRGSSSRSIQNVTDPQHWSTVPGPGTYIPGTYVGVGSFSIFCLTRTSRPENQSLITLQTRCLVKFIHQESAWTLLGNLYFWQAVPLFQINDLKRFKTKNECTNNAHR